MKDLDDEIVDLKQVMNDVKRMLDEVSQKYDDLEERVLSSIKDKNQGETQNHIDEHQSNAGPFICQTCKREFDKGWKLRAHVKIHSVVKCNLCEQNFPFKELMEKHVKIVHENVMWFCHFYNNGKECPKGVKCIFLHEDSGYCRYKNLCERTYCMFKHDKCEYEDSGAVKDSIWEVNEEELEVSECVDVSGNMEQTFCNPSQTGKVDLSLETDEQDFKCRMCEYEATTKHDLKNHEDENHNWCWVCEKNFENKREFKVHHYTLHSKSKSIWD